jgi:predicted metal-dependent phosphotriesterase family hydrolase
MSLEPFPLDLEEIIIGHVDMEEDSMEKEERVIHNISIL